MIDAVIAYDDMNITKERMLCITDDSLPVRMNDPYVYPWHGQAIFVNRCITPGTFEYRKRVVLLMYLP